MKALLLSCRKFESIVKKLATKPAGILPEPVMLNRKYESKKSIVCLITLESNDPIMEVIPKISQEIRKFSKDTAINTIVIFPFAHLSNKIASSTETISFLDALQRNLKEFEILRVHFGSHKSLLLDIFGHKGNVRWREF